MTIKLENAKLAIIGLGYVGLPLAVEFAKKYSVIGFDINENRIAALNAGHDATLEVDDEELAAARNLVFSSDPAILGGANIYIVTVPTPIDEHRRPDLTPLVKASEVIGRVLSPGDIVIYESTVYPGCTEEDCVPILEQHSGLAYISGSELLPKSEAGKPEADKGFFAGYSPERINPGDKSRGVTTIVKVTSGSTPEIAEFVDSLYSSIITAGTFRASSIRVAEAAKVIENTQRDLNIALVNELAMLFNRMGIDTEEVLEAAGTKWNFLPFRPGLVGGHCIGVDPYYLTHKAQSVGYHPEIILSGRRINDGMGRFVASELVKAMLGKCIQVNGAKVLIMGLAFKENCPDLRNTRVIDVIHELQEYNVEVDVYDPWVNPDEALREYGINPVNKLEPNTYDGIVLAVAHKQFKAMGLHDIRVLGANAHVIYDLKHILQKDAVDLRL